MSDYAFRKKYRITDCRIQQIWKAKRLMFLRGFLRISRGEVINIDPHEEDVTVKQLSKRLYIYAEGHRCMIRPFRKHNKKVVRDALEKVRQRNEAKYRKII